MRVQWQKGFGAKKWREFTNKKYLVVSFETPIAYGLENAFIEVNLQEEIPAHSLFLS